MPKEKRTDHIDTSDIVIGWSPDGYVQLGTERHGDTPLWTEESDDGLIGEGFFGFHGSLSRADVNWVIKTLRKARDAAFGRDE